ncbi:H+-ATPase subunit H [Candidatus Methanophagaceae archaeon]|nr:H+-ATPase subunit H [Methanophagales archaeon]
MAVEALKLIRETEEEGRRLLDETKGNAAVIAKEAEQEINRLKENAGEAEKSLTQAVSDKYAKEGEIEGKAIQAKADAEAEELKAVAESNLDSAVNLVLERILGLR